MGTAKTGYTREFIDDYEPFNELVKTEEERSKLKKVLKERGFQVIRSKWLSGLGYFQIVGTRYKHGKPDPKRLKKMRRFTTTC